MKVLRRLILLAGTIWQLYCSRTCDIAAWGAESRRAALGGLIIAIALFTAAMSYAGYVGAPASLECKYYYHVNGSGNNALTGCDSRGLPIVPSNPLGTVTGCAVSDGGV